MKARADRLPPRGAGVAGAEVARARAAPPASPARATDVRAKNGGGPFGRRWFLAVAFRGTG